MYKIYRFLWPYLILSALFCGRAQAEFDAQCPTKDHVLLNDDEVAPEGIKAFLSGHAGEVNSVDDFICCLPKSYRKSFVVIHSSISAQSSDIHGPRVILFNSTPPRKDGLPHLQSAISFNGGSPNLNNHKNIEIVYNNEAAKEVELYDVDFEKRFPRLSDKNPELCLSCHGENGRAGIGGPKPIFEDVDQWTRAVQGIHVSDREEPLARAIERAAERTFQTNARYRCLDQQVARDDHFSGHSTSTAPELQSLDFMLSLMNERRLAKVIKATPQYEKFKFAIIGSLGCFQFENCSSDDPSVKLPHACNANLSGWIPARTLEKMNDTGFIDERLKGSQNLRQTVLKIFKDSYENQLEILARQNKIIQQLDQGLAPAIEIYRGPLSPNNDEGEIQIRARNLNAKLIGSTPLDFYKADSEVRAVRGGLFNPFFKYIFESRGIDIGNFSMDPLPNSYTRTPTLVLVQELIKLEKGGSVLKNLKSRLIDAELMPPDVVTPELLSRNRDPVELLEKRKQACGHLQSLSYSTLMSQP